MQLRTRALLDDIQQSIHHVLEDTADMTRDEFVHARLVRQAVERNFEIIGEAMNRCYDVINYSMVWHAVTVSLPLLEKEVNAQLRVSS